MSAVLDDCVRLEELRHDQMHSSAIIQAGTRAVPITPRQASNDEITILAQREKAADELLKVVNQALQAAKKSKLKIPSGKRKRDGINFKEISKIREKAKNEYASDVPRVVDMVRCTILAGDTDDLQTLSEIFRPCVNPNVVRFRNEFNKVNPEKGGIRRLQVNVALPDAEGHVAEILVFYGPSLDKYEASRKEYGKQRQAEQAIERSDQSAQGYKALVKASQIAKQASINRKKANDEAAAFPEVRNLVMEQSAYQIDEFPVVINDDGHKGIRFALVPNPASGFWETDQRFLDIIDNPEDYPDHSVHRISTFEAQVRGEALCRSDEIRGQFATPSL